jgi:hypothetical protein
MSDDWIHRKVRSLPKTLLSPASWAAFAFSLSAVFAVFAVTHPRLFSALWFGIPSSLPPFAFAQIPRCFPFPLSRLSDFRFGSFPS